MCLRRVCKRGSGWGGGWLVVVVVVVVVGCSNVAVVV